MVYVAEVQEIYICGGDWRTELWGFAKEEPFFFGVYAKMAEEGNGAVR